MSDYQTDDYSDAEEDSKPNFRRDLEKRAREAEARAKEYEQKLTTLERQSVFRDAGLDPSNKQHAVFMKAYDGELSLDAVRADAVETGFLAPATAPVSKDELDTHARFDRASLDAQPVAAVGTNEDAMSKIMGATSEADFYAAVKAAGLEKLG